MTTASATAPDRRDPHARPEARARDKAMLRSFAITRSPQLREDIVHRFMPLARRLAFRYRRHAEPMDDLVQVANLGLVKAVDNFDPGRGSPFNAYAVPTILGELRRHFRDHVWTVRLPRGLQELTMKIDQATTRLAEELGEYPTATQISERIGVSVEDVLDGIEAGHARRTASLDAPVSSDEESMPMIDTIADAETGYDRVEADAAARDAGLDDREWLVLRMRFTDNLTQREIGRRLGVSQMQISRISRRALGKLLDAVRAEPPESSGGRSPAG